MKPILFLAAILLAAAVTAQENKISELEKRFPWLKEQRQGLTDLKQLTQPKIFQQAPKLILPSQPVTVIGQIPCIKPDMSQFNMPNAWTGPKPDPSAPAAIPNPAIPEGSKEGLADR